MKNKKLLILASVFISATILGACTTEGESSIKNDFSNDLMKFKNAEYLSTYIFLKNNFNEVELNGVSQMEKDETVYLVEDNEKAIYYNRNKEQIEMILTTKVTNEVVYSDELIDIPIIIDLKNDKTYVGTDWIVNYLEIIYANLANKLSNEQPDKVKDYDFESVKKEFNNARKSQFIELEEAKKTSIFLLTDIDFDSLLQEKFLINPNTNESSIKKSNELIESFDIGNFEEHKYGIILKVPNEKTEKFMDNTNLLQFSKINEKELSETSFLELVKNNEYKNLENVKIENVYYKNELKDIYLNYDVNLGINDISYKQQIKYTDIKMNKEDIKFFHDLKTLPIITSKDDILNLDDEINNLRLKSFEIFKKLN